MNRQLVDRIVEAVLYEGYMLYPYRPSVKNRQRWSFGGLFPLDYTRHHQTGDASLMQSECLMLGGHQTTLEVSVRFLHIIDRTIWEIDGTRAESEWVVDGGLHQVDSLDVGDQHYVPWQEAAEREIVIGPFTLEQLSAGVHKRQSFAFPHELRNEPLRDGDGTIVGVLVREQQPLLGVLELSASADSDRLFKITARIENQTPLADAGTCSREKALVQSLVSTHTILSVREGRFVSLTDVPTELQAAAGSCQNIGTWPVLVGDPGETDTILSSPIILGDYPQIAPESPGNLFDGTEIDEILSLRILALSDAEKRQVAAVDDRARALLSRTEALAREELSSLHGAIRGLRPVPAGGAR